MRLEIMGFFRYGDLMCLRVSDGVVFLQINRQGSKFVFVLFWKEVERAYRRFCQERGWVGSGELFCGLSGVVIGNGRLGFFFVYGFFVFSSGCFSFFEIGSQFYGFFYEFLRISFIYQEGFRSQIFRKVCSFAFLGVGFCSFIVYIDRQGWCFYVGFDVEGGVGFENSRLVLVGFVLLVFEYFGQLGWGQSSQ